MISLTLLPLGLKFDAALAAAHRQAGQRVLEGLLEGEELEDRFVDRGVEADSALIGADRIVVLDPVAALDPDVALVVLPADPEGDDPVGLGHAPQDLGLVIFGLALGELEYVLGDLVDRLDEFGLVRVAALDAFHEAFEVDMLPSRGAPPPLFMRSFPSPRCVGAESRGGVAG